MSTIRKKNIRFLIIYNSFSESEKSEFKNFILYSPGNSRRNYNRILSSLTINEKGIIELPDAKTDRTRWNRLSELHLLAEKFLTLKSIESDSFVNRFLLITEYHKRELEIPFKQSYKKLITEITDEPVVNYNYYHISQLDKIYQDYLRSKHDLNSSSEYFVRSGNFRTGIQMIELLDHLIKIWNMKAAGILNTKSLDEEIFESLNFENILLTLSRNSDSPDKLYQTLKFLYLVYICLNDPENEENYVNAKRIFFRDLKSLSPVNRSQFLNYLIGIMIERSNLSIPGSKEELFYLMNKKLKAGFIDDFHNSEKAINGFRDYLHTSIGLGKFRWANNFINKYGPLLPPDIREDNILLGKALVLFSENKFLICSELLAKIKKKNPFFFVDVSVLKLKVIFELKQFDECHEELKRFSEYLRRERVIQDHLRVYAKEFCNAFKLLLKLKRTPDKTNLNELEFLLSQKEMIGKKWIILKMNEITKNYLQN